MVENNKEHDHTREDQTHGITREVKEIIIELFKAGITRPLNIIYALRHRRVTNIPSQRQISNFKAKLIEELYGASNISFADMEDWCRARQFESEVNQHFAFVLDYLFKGEYFNICFSTKYLLSLARDASIIVIDATYKLNFQGFPLIVSGTIDCERQFHPIVVSLSSDETTKSYEFHFKTIKRKLADLYNVEFKPSILMADAADQTTLAFENVFTHDYTRLMCWAHTQRAISNKLSTISDKFIRDEIMKNINTLHLSYSQTNFDISLKLFQKKWKQNSLVCSFLSYFNKEWIWSKNNNWYEGASIRAPSTNNALEATNNAIKMVHTQRERPGVSHFLSKVLVIMENWSQDRDDLVGLKKIHKSIVISNEVWYSAYCFIQEKPMVKCVNYMNKTYYLVAKDNVDQEYVDKYEDIMLCEASCVECFDNVSFDDYISLNNMICRVEIDDEWTKSTCTCFNFLKQYMCKHIIAVAVSLSLVQIDDKHKIISRKAKRGRKKKARLALELQSD